MFSHCLIHSDHNFKSFFPSHYNSKHKLSRFKNSYTIFPRIFAFPLFFPSSVISSHVKENTFCKKKRDSYFSWFQILWIFYKCFCRCYWIKLINFWELLQIFGSQGKVLLWFETFLSKDFVEGFFMLNKVEGSKSKHSVSCLFS